MSDASGSLDAYREVWVCDTEFETPPAERPLPLCLVARELRTGRTIRLWWDELRSRREAPFPTDRGVLFVAYFAPAELACFLALGWSLPRRVLDLYAEFRCLTNGLNPSHGNGLLAALAWHGLDAIEASQKTAMRDLARRVARDSGRCTGAEREAVLEYCASDVIATERLLIAMMPGLDPERAVVRGRYMAAVARIEEAGIPLDVATLERLRSRWPPIKERLIGELGGGLYEGGVFKLKRFEALLAAEEIAWPRTALGNLRLDEETLEEMAQVHPVLEPIWRVRHDLGQVRLQNLLTGRDGRTRASLGPFRAKSGRNAPGMGGDPDRSVFLFSQPAWVRSLAKPGPGRSIAYVDWSQQEVAIAAVLARDPAMIAAYESGDVYLAFGKQAGLIPPTGTKQTHKAERDRCKACVLGVGYGMEAASLARRIGQPTIYARELLQLHKATYPAFWAWADGAVNRAVLFGELQTVFGWRFQTAREFNPRTLRNYPCQGNGAEMLRLACSLATERGLGVIAPVHDALLIEAPTTEIREAVARLRECMAEASRIVLGGFELRSDAVVVSWPDRFRDERGVAFWARIMGLLDRIEREEGSVISGGPVGHLAS